MKRWALALVVLAVACGSLERLERMIDQPRGDAYRASALFPDGKVMRMPPAGTVPRELEVEDGGSSPAERLAYGRRRFEIICATCHGVRGDGDSPVAHAMEVRRPPSLHSARVRALSSERIEDVIARGYGLMPSYAAQLDEPGRKAVADYVRALQLSQSVRLDALPSPLQGEARRELGAP